MTIESVVVGTNAELMAHAAELYLEDGDRIVDVTHGAGILWRRLEGLEVTAHDLNIDGVDCRDLPYADGTIDVVVFDPPYRISQGTETYDLADFRDRYGLEHAPTNPTELRGLYRDGIAEAARVLGPRGRLFVKAQDYAYGRRFYSAVAMVDDLAGKVGLSALDVFVLYAGAGPRSGSWLRQSHARRVHSYLVIFAAAPSWRRRPTHRPDPIQRARGPERLFD